MRRSTVTLIVLLAVLLMPLGMGAAPASAHRNPTVERPMQHCPQQSPTDGKAGFTECVMACSVALPASQAAAYEPLLLGCVPPTPRVAKSLHGLHPEAAIPPPKNS